MLESYITPLLMSYVDKYIKNLKPSDLSLSLWGGDVVLYNLELRLDVLEKVRRSSKILTLTSSYTGVFPQMHCKHLMHVILFYLVHLN